jgi:hypothetical protein
VGRFMRGGRAGTQVVSDAAAQGGQRFRPHAHHQAGPSLKNADARRVRAVSAPTRPRQNLGHECVGTDTPVTLRRAVDLGAKLRRAAGDALRL